MDFSRKVLNVSELISLMKQVGTDVLESPPVELESLEYDLSFERALEEDNIDVEEVKKNAPWLKQPGEQDDEYWWFKQYVNLAINEWEYENLALSLDVDVTILSVVAERNNWKKRRFAYISYQEWLRRRKDEIEQLEQIDKFRLSQAKIVHRTTDSASILIEKLHQKINGLTVDNIKVSEIPSFIKAVADLTKLSAESEARALAVARLLDLYGDEMDFEGIQQHIKLSEKDGLKQR